MSNNKQKKSLLIFLGIVFGLVLLIIGGIIYWQKVRYKTNAELGDLDWPYGQMLINFQDNDYTYIKSTDGQINVQFRNDFEELYGSEILSLTKHLHFGQLKTGEKGLYYITPEKVQLVSDQLENVYSLSLSPDGKYLRYYTPGKLCIASFSETELGDCVDLLAELPGQWDWENKDFTEGDWYKEGGEYLVIIRSKTEHYLEEAGENQPPRRVQLEVARFIYNPEQQTFKQLDLDADYILKTEMPLQTEEENKLIEYFNRPGLYDFVYDRVNSRVLIKEYSTGRKAELAKGEYFGDMPAFSIQWSAGFSFSQ